MDFQSKKSFEKLRVRAFQPYHQILCVLKHVSDVRDVGDLQNQIRDESNYIASDLLLRYFTSPTSPT